MRKINPKTKADRDNEHIIVSKGKNIVAVRLRKKDDTYFMITLSIPEWKDVVKELKKHGI